MSGDTTTGTNSAPDTPGPAPSASPPPFLEIDGATEAASKFMEALTLTKTAWSAWRRAQNTFDSLSLALDALHKKLAAIDGERAQWIRDGLAWIADRQNTLADHGSGALPLFLALGEILDRRRAVVEQLPAAEAAENEARTAAAAALVELDAKRSLLAEAAEAMRGQLLIYW